MILLCIFLFINCVYGAEFTLPGECPNVKLQENFDKKFAGTWYNVASFASDHRSIYDCSSMEFLEDNVGWTLRENYVDIDQDVRTQKSYFARMDPTFDADNTAKFIISHENGDKVLQFPFSILSTDYENYAIAYTCKTLKKTPRTHYVFSWILTRNKKKLEGVELMQVEDALSKYAELKENKKSFVHKDFSQESCAFTNKYGVDFFTNNFW